MSFNIEPVDLGLPPLLPRPDARQLWRLAGPMTIRISARLTIRSPSCCSTPAGDDEAGRSRLAAEPPTRCALVPNSPTLHVLTARGRPTRGLRPPCNPPRNHVRSDPVCWFFGIRRDQVICPCLSPYEGAGVPFLPGVGSGRARTRDLADPHYWQRLATSPLACQPPGAPPLD